jgi:hypothetical protein
VKFITKIVASAMRSKVTILLDENLLELKDGLRDAGFKVLTLKQGMSDEDIGELAEGHAILTKNTKDFIGNAKAFDYDIISVEKIKFIDTAKTKKNLTVQKIVKAVRESQFYVLRGNFLLRILDSGKFKIEEIVI